MRNATESSISERNGRVLQGLLKLQRAKLSSKGVLDFSNQRIFNLSELGKQKCLKTLILDGSPLKTLESLPSQQCLQILRADNSMISSFLGLSRHPQLKSISLRNSPISEIENFRVCCAIVCSNNLVEINGKRITKEERSLARKYPPIARLLLEDGWQLVIPPPSSEEFRQLAIQHNLTIQDVDPDFSNEIAEQYLRCPMTLASRRYNQISDDDSSENLILEEEELIDDLIEVLSTIGIRIPRDDQSKDDIIDAIEMLATILQDLKQDE